MIIYRTKLNNIFLPPTYDINKQARRGRIDFMPSQLNRSFQFQPRGPYHAYLPQFDYTATYTPAEKSIKKHVSYYLLKALVVIQSALRILKSSSPFFEQYSPLLKQLPNMYKMIKLIQDVKDETGEDELDENEGLKREPAKQENESHITSPTLFI